MDPNTDLRPLQIGAAHIRELSLFSRTGWRTRFSVAAHFSDPLVLSFYTVFFAATENKPGKSRSKPSILIRKE
ncbi:MAG: hypothetical protein Q8P67_16720 [archaeon]|nr:hypothetical protein [archaeon]